MMIQLHEGLRRYGLQIIVWAMLISMAIGYLAVFFDTRRSASNSPSILTINGTSISTQAYQRAHTIIEQRIQAIKAQFGRQADYILSIMGLSNTKDYTLNSLVSGVLLEQLADKAGVIAQPSYIPFLLSNPSTSFQLLSEVLPLSVFDQKGALSSLMLNNYLKSTNSSYAELEQTLLAKMKESIIQTVVKSCAHTLDKQVLERCTQKYQHRSYAYFILNKDSYLQQIYTTPPSDEQLKEFHALNNKKNKRYWSVEKREGSYVTFDANNWGIRPTQQEIEHYYTNHKALFILQPAQITVRHILLTGDEAATEAQQVLEELKKDPALFEQLAQRYSKDISTASAGGLLPNFAKGTHDTAFEKAAFSLRANNDISQPLQTSQGIEIIQRVDKTAVQYKSLQQAQQMINDRLITQKFSYIFTHFMSKWIVDHVPALKDLIDQKHAQASQALSCGKSDTSALARKLFSLKKNGQGFFVQKAQGFLISLTDIFPAKPLSFEECKDQVLKDYQEHQAHAMLLESKATLEKRFSNTTLSNEEFKAVADHYAQPMYTTALIDPGLKNDQPLEKALTIGDLLEVYQLATAALVPIKEGIVVVYVAQNTPVDSQVLKDKKGDIKADIDRTMQMTTLKGLVASLHRNATISNGKALDF